MTKNIHQGDVFFINIDEKETVGSEQFGSRPFVIVSSNLANSNSGNVIACPITSKNKKDLPTHYILEKEDYNFLVYECNIVLTENIRSISKKRLERKIGKILKKDIKEILLKLNKNFT